MTDSLFQLELIMRIAIACVCGLMIGFERKTRSKEAGVRTHVIVALGSALMMIVSKYGFYDSASFDASRVAAQIVSGIGFLGAGIIFVRNRSVSGLTTAAGIWATAGVGMAVGAGMYILGVGACLLLLLIQLITHLSRLSHHPFMVSEVIFEMNDLQSVLDIQRLLERHKIQIEDMTIERNGTFYEVQLLARTANDAQLQQLLGDLENIQGVQKVSI